jgi:hypothetical protein
MLERIAETSLRLKARIAGALYLSGILNLVAGTVIGGLVVKGDAAATARNILTHEAWYRLAFAGDIVTVPCYIAVSVLYYDLFKPVNRSIALLGACFGLAGSTMWALNDFSYLGPLVVLGGAHSSNVADPLQALALLFLNLHSQCSNIVMVAFGFHVILVGYLIFRSTFLPRFLGVWLATAGVCYLTNSFANFLSPEFAAHLLPYILFPGTVEIVLALWLLVRGVNVQRWKALASAAVQ